MAGESETRAGRRTAVKVGALLGGLIGALFSAGYGASSVWICSGATVCASHWVPFVVLPVAIFVGSIAVGVAIAFLLRRFYELTRV